MYNILFIIQNFPTLHSEKPKNISQKFIKLDKTTIQNKNRNRKIELTSKSNSFS